MRYTVFEYMYRDAANYKVFGSLWLDGEFPDEDKERFASLLEMDEFFIAEQVAIPALQPLLGSASDLNTDDHVWHSFVRFRPEGCLPRDQKLHETWNVFIRRFDEVSGNWRIDHSDFYAKF